ncbi:MAG: dihydrodipicolinate synthase family protein [Armatimonadota bacterium]|nr:dihydrodipicolinate synthase family protein [Armatimonadota bacterium]MDR7518036.1 dihydrodipicolinate synthase family protein [Armatimonadota bacterium]MDR7550499.1 dihydrodipicolinate synthase family protein [Armatimonadota bacterium]
MPVPEYAGVLPALAIPFKEDYSLDFDGIRRLAQWMASVPGITGIVTNGHTGEVGSLLPEERAEVTACVAEAVRGRAKVVSGVCAEGTFEAVAHAKAAARAGADAILLMPCHMWLRFGVTERAVFEYFKAVGAESGLDIVVHLYPAYTRASYSTRLLVELATIPQVKAVKMGQRDFGKYERDVRTLRAEAPHLGLLSCMDEYLLPTFAYGVDGALVGLASLVPELVVGLYEAMRAGDLERARQVNDRIWPIKEAVYGSGEPSGDAHARLKVGMAARGLLTHPRVRPPVLPPSRDEEARVRSAMEQSGVSRVDLVPVNV